MTLTKTDARTLAVHAIGNLVYYPTSRRGTPISKCEHYDLDVARIAGALLAVSRGDNDGAVRALISLSVREAEGLVDAAPESPATEAWLAQRPGLAQLRIYVAQGMQRDAFDQPAEFRGLLGDYVRQRSRDLGAGDLNRLALLGEPLPPQVTVGRIGTAEFWTVAVDPVVRRTEEAAANTAGVVTP